MEVVVIGADNNIGTREVDNDFGIMDLIGGGIMRIVRPMGLRGTGLVMIVDDNGIAKGFAKNRAAGALYRGRIVGDAVICPEVAGPDGPELAGFRESMARKFMKQIMEKAPYLESGQSETKGSGEKELPDTFYLLAEHPRRSPTAFQPKAVVPAYLSETSDTVFSGYVVLHDGKGPAPGRMVPNAFAIFLGAEMIYGDCLLARKGPDGPEKLSMKETEGIMETLGYEKSDWFDRETFEIYRDFTVPVSRQDIPESDGKKRGRKMTPDPLTR